MNRSERETVQAECIIYRFDKMGFRDCKFGTAPALLLPSLKSVLLVNFQIRCYSNFLNLWNILMMLKKYNSMFLWRRYYKLLAAGLKHTIFVYLTKPFNIVLG